MLSVNNAILTTPINVILIETLSHVFNSPFFEIILSLNATPTITISKTATYPHSICSRSSPRKLSSGAYKSIPDDMMPSIRAIPTKSLSDRRKMNEVLVNCHRIQQLDSVSLDEPWICCKSGFILVQMLITMVLCSFICKMDLWHIQFWFHIIKWRFMCFQLFRIYRAMQLTLVLNKYYVDN